ncbi:hypothetical protein FGADI_2629 [Fusarium gaditjirri]|uniref:Uncharacterized protein n=1 Tax=Fusarium gaditjirri TaxID=282569 RepID=A0A8H4THY7_9HYPO|nr:hypothetical protein FGADI_2629 [Fusarium gaditjirri]
MTGRHKAIRLPPLKTLRVHNPKREVENPCIAIMSSVLGANSPTPLRFTVAITDHDRLVRQVTNKLQRAGPQQVSTQRAAQQ